MPGSHKDTLPGMEAYSTPGSASSLSMSISSTSSTPNIRQPLSISTSGLPVMEASSNPGSASSLSMSISSTSSTLDIRQPLPIPAFGTPGSQDRTVSGMSASSLSMSISSTSSTPDIQQPPSIPASGITPPWRRPFQVTPPWRRANDNSAARVNVPGALSFGQQGQQHVPGPLLIGQPVSSGDIHHPRPVRPISRVTSMWEVEDLIDEK